MVVLVPLIILEKSWTPSPKGLYISILHTVLGGFCAGSWSPIHKPPPAPAPAAGLRWEAVTGPAHSRAAQLWMWVLWSSVGWTFRRECVKAVGGGLVEFLIEKRKYGRHQNSMVLITYYCSVQSLSCVRLFATPWTAACQASLSFTVSWSLVKPCRRLVMLSSHLILCCPLLLCL